MLTYVTGCCKLTSPAYRVQTYHVRRSLDYSLINDMSTKFSGWGKWRGESKQNRFSLKSSLEPDWVWCSGAVSSINCENRPNCNNILKFGIKFYYTILYEKKDRDTHELDFLSIRLV